MRIEEYSNKPEAGWKPAGSVNFRGSRKPAEGKKCGCGEAEAASQPLSFRGSRKPAGGKAMRLRRSRAASRPVNFRVKNP
jgi:hypothetical protein